MADAEPWAQSPGSSLGISAGAEVGLRSWQMGIWHSAHQHTSMLLVNKRNQQSKLYWKNELILTYFQDSLIFGFRTDLTLAPHWYISLIYNISLCSCSQSVIRTRSRSKLNYEQTLVIFRPVLSDVWSHICRREGVLCHRGLHRSRTNLIATGGAGSRE